MAKKRSKSRLHTSEGPVRLGDVVADVVLWEGVHLSTLDDVGILVEDVGEISWWMDDAARELFDDLAETDEDEPYAHHVGQALSGVAELAVVAAETGNAKTVSLVMEALRANIDATIELLVRAKASA